MLIFKKPKLTFLQGEFQPFCMLFILEDITQYCFITQVQIGKNFWPKFLWSPWSNGQHVRKGCKGSRVQIPKDLQGFSFSENKHRGPYFVGFQIMQFGYLQTMLDHPAKVPQLYPSLLLNCPLAHCGSLIFWKMTSLFLKSLKNPTSQ